MASVLDDMGLSATVDRAALAGYCQAYGRWVEAETKLAEGPTLIRTSSGYVQQSPWLSISNKSQELMDNNIAELRTSKNVLYVPGWTIWWMPRRGGLHRAGTLGGCVV